MTSSLIGPFLFYNFEPCDGFLDLYEQIFKYTVHTVYPHKHTFFHIQAYMNIQAKYYLLIMKNKIITKRQEKEEA